MNLRRWIGALFLTMVFDAQVARSASDLDGPWFASAKIGEATLATCMLEFDTAMGFQLTGDCTPALFSDIALTGSIDVPSGAFTATGTAGAVCAVASIEGTVSVDRRSFTASLTCDALPIVLMLEGTRCGNRRIDDGEECDDGNHDEGDCCSAECVLGLEGSACDDENSCTSGDHCESGTCIASTLPDGAVCDDGSACTEDDRCDGGGCRSGAAVTCGDTCQTCDPGVGCVFAPDWSCDFFDTVAALDLRNGRDASNDSVVANVSRGSLPGLVELGDPRTETSYDVCAYDDLGLLARFNAPAGSTCGERPCWTALGNGFRYRSRARDTVESLQLRVDGSGRLQVRARGRGSELGIDRMPMTQGWSSVQVRGSNGFCIGSFFPSWTRLRPDAARAHSDWRF